MSNAKLIKDTLGETGYSAYHGFTESDERVYFIFHCDTEPENHADDRPLCELTYVTVHLFCKSDFDPFELLEQTKRALFAADFTWPEVMTLAGSNTGYGETDDLRHFLIECEKTDFISIN